MTPERWQQVARVYQSAMEQEPGTRGAYLTSVCGDDAELRREVESLLAQPSTPGLIDRPLVDAAPVAFGITTNLAPGTMIGPYRVVDLIGEGGMGQVYRATDTNLGRQVAIKVLPTAFVQDRERLARFEREAKTLAALNHPHIAQIYGLERSATTPALVMELVEGETLADRIARGPIPIDEALPIAKQIAEALEAAHEQGIIHRDLKPANIKVRDDGTVKVLDFGLAKALEPVGGPTGAATISPTITSPAMMTGVGVLLGTAAYMSPEQARGKPADKRSDIWAFGCVLYEMLTGQRAFTGEDVTDTLANVLKSEPDWTSVPDVVPSAIRALVKSCLGKDRHHRLGDIAAARFALDELSVETVQRSPVRRAPIWRRTMPVAAFGILSALIAALVVWQVKTPTPSPVIRLTLPSGEGETLVGSRRLLAISPDGSRVAYMSSSGLYVRSLSDSQPKKLLAGESEGNQIQDVAFSPDGQSIAFYSVSDRTLKRISISGGTPVAVCAIDAPNGIDWSPEAIVFGMQRKGVMRVNPDGGMPTTLVDIPPDQLVVQLQLLPGGRNVLFTLADSSAALDFDRAQIVVQSLDSGERHVLIKGGTDARYVPTGHVLYALGGVLWAVPFDIRRQQVTGAPVAVVEGVARGTGIVGSATAQFSVADAGTLVYVPGPPALSSSRRQLVSIDPDGTSRPLNVGAGPYASPRIAPGGNSLAVVIDDGKNVDVWIADLTSARSMRRLTFEGRNRFPVWSPDGRRVMFQSDRQGDRAIWWQPADGSGAAERLTTAAGGAAHIPEAWIGHTDSVLFSVVSSPEKASLWTLSVATKHTERFDAVTSANPLDSSVSPDGRWVAYTLRGAGKAYVYVQPNPPTGAKYEVTDQGHHPLWTPDGGQLQFLPGAGRLAAVKVTTSPSLSFSVAQPVPGGFSANTSSDSGRNHDVTPQGEIIAALSAAETAGSESAPTHIEVVLNWLDELKQRVPPR